MKLEIKLRGEENAKAVWTLLTERGHKAAGANLSNHWFCLYVDIAATPSGVKEFIANALPDIAVSVKSLEPPAAKHDLSLTSKQRSQRKYNQARAEKAKHLDNCRVQWSVLGTKNAFDLNDILVAAIDDPANPDKPLPWRMQQKGKYWVWTSNQNASPAQTTDWLKRIAPGFTIGVRSVPDEEPVVSQAPKLDWSGF